MKEIAIICNIDKTLTTHTARHSFACLAMELSIPIDIIAKVLGHTNTNMTRLIGGRVVVAPAADGSVWMSQHEIAALFGVFVSAAGANIRSILKSEVLHEDEVCLTYRYDNGGSVELYNLEMITALAFRIRSRNAEVFRRWLMQKAIRHTNDRSVSVVISLCKNTVAN